VLCFVLLLFFFFLFFFFSLFLLCLYFFPSFAPLLCWRIAFPTGRSSSSISKRNALRYSWDNNIFLFYFFFFFLSFLLLPFFFYFVIICALALALAIPAAALVEAAAAAAAAVFPFCALRCLIAAARCWLQHAASASEHARQGAHKTKGIPTFWLPQ